MPGVMLLLMHGWGFDRTIWTRMCEHLDGVPTVLADQGYFGRAERPHVAGDVVAIGHSLGAMLLLRDPPPNCVALIAINGFDRFTATSGFPGVAPRVVDRMATRLAVTPDRVVADFRARCGMSSMADGPPDTERLARDLALLRDGDARPSSRASRFPILSLQAKDDPILPRALQDAVFSGAGQVTRERCDTGGHLLPLTRPEWCAAHVGRMMAS
jgi:pimeloyl-[acyl-carrier protein] methyl ester esterase